MEEMKYSNIYMGGLNALDFKYDINEATHLINHNIFLQPYREAKHKIGTFACKCGAVCEDDTTVVYDIFHTIEKWEPRKIVEEDDGSLTMDDESLTFIHLCHANVYCKKCASIRKVYSSLDYEDQMEIIIDNFSKMGIHFDMPCRPRDADDIYLMVTAFNADHSIFLTDDSEEYYHYTGEEYDYDCDDEDEEKDPDEVDDKGWKKAWDKYNEKC